MGRLLSSPGALAWPALLAAGFACTSKSANAPIDAGLDETSVEEATPLDPEGMFRAFQTELVATCGGNGGTCHVEGTFMSAPTWLANPDPYVSAKKYPGILPASNNPLDSKLLTQTEHEGPALVTTQDLFERVRAWVVAEVAERGVKLPATDPIAVVDGNNEVDLSSLVGGLAGTKLTFMASSGNGLLTILEMKISAPFPKALHVEAPFFVIIPSEGPTITDTVDGFPGALDVPNGQTVSFFNGSAVLQKWDSAGKLKIVFNKFETVLPDDGGTGAACGALAAFTASAVPAFKLDLGSGTSCVTCHAGGSAAAKFAMDLSKVDTDNASACAQALHRIVRKNPAASQILLTPTGNPAGDPSHPVRDVCPGQTLTDAGALLCVPQPLIDDLTAWINAE